MSNLPSSPSTHAPVSQPSPDIPQRRVLVIDDEQTIRIALRRFFSRMGWAVEDAPDGEAGLEILLDEPVGTTRFTLVLSDLRMPGLSGIDLYDRLRVSRPDTIDRLVFSTGDLVSEDAAAFVDATRCVVLQKPFELSALRELAERAATYGLVSGKN